MLVTYKSSGHNSIGDVEVLGKVTALDGKTGKVTLEYCISWKLNCLLNIVQASLFVLAPILSKFLMEELIRIFILSFLSVAWSGIVFFRLYLLLPTP